MYNSCEVWHDTLPAYELHTQATAYFTLGHRREPCRRIQLHTL